MLLYRKLKNQKGVAIVEFAIALPLLLLLLAGFIEFGFLLYNKQVITNASREGARAAINPLPEPLSDSHIETIVRQYCQANLITFSSVQNEPEVDIRPSEPGRILGVDVIVDVTYEYEFLFNIIRRLFGSNVSTFELGSRTTMRMM